MQFLAENWQIVGGVCLYLLLVIGFSMMGRFLKECDEDLEKEMKK